LTGGLKGGSLAGRRWLSAASCGNQKEVPIVYVGVHHRIKDADAAFSRGQALLQGDDAPPGVQLREFYPSQDRTAATCLWEGDSLESVREYVDSTLSDAAENTYFEVDAEQSVGLPRPAAAGA
jgi:hypothetical protein